MYNVVVTGSAATSMLHGIQTCSDSHESTVQKNRGVDLKQPLDSG